MVKEAEANAETDKERRELVEARNQGEALIHSTEKTLSEYGDKISEADKSTIEQAVADLKSALEGEDLSAINGKSQALAEASMKLGEAMYQSQQAGAEDDTPSDGPGGPSEEDVVDADFEEVDDDDQKKSA